MPVDLRAAPATATLNLKFLDFRLRVETNSLRAATRLALYFAAYLAPPDGEPSVRLRAIAAQPEYDASRLAVWPRSIAGRSPKESYYEGDSMRFILKTRTGMLITVADDEASIIGDIEKHLNQVVNLANTLFGMSLANRGYVMLHASAVVRRGNDDVLIFMGNSGSGKSSLALQIIERGGYDYISNDRVLLKAGKRGVHVVGLPKKPRVNPGTLLASKALVRLLPPRKRGIYARLDPSALSLVEEKRDVDVQRTLGADEKLEGRLARAFCLEWSPSGRGMQIEPLDAARALDAMHSVRKDFGPFDRQRDRRDPEPQYRRIASVSQFSRVTGRFDPERLARSLRNAAGSR